MAKPKAKPRLTDAERHDRFKEMVKEVGASEDAEDFEKAFKRVTRSTVPTPQNRS